MPTFELSAGILTLVPIVIGVTAVAKNYVDSRWAPVVSLILGVAGAFLVGGAPIATVILSGIVVGLTASGLYSGTKATITPAN